MNKVPPGKRTTLPKTAVDSISVANPFLNLLAAQAGTKALQSNVAFEDPGRPVDTVDLNLGRLSGQNPNGGMSGAHGPRLTQKNAARHLEAYGGPQAMDWVMNCTRYVADIVSNASFHFESPSKIPTAEKLPGDPVAPDISLKQLLDSPNPYQDYIEMMELLVIDLLLVGNAYWFKWRTTESGKPLALYRLAPPYIEVETKPWGIASYIYQIPNADKLYIEPENVIHFKLANPDPANPYYGLGIISGAGRAADLEIGLTDSQASYYENHAMPSATLESARRVPRDVFKKIRSQLHARSQGPKNAGELLVLEAGLKLNSVAPTATDAAFLEVSKMSRDRVFSWFRMSPKLLGLMDEQAGADKISDVQRQFDMRTARPLMNKLQTKITKELVAAWDLDFKIDYEYQLDPAEQAALATAYAPLPGIMVDELRKFAGLPPLKDKAIGELVLNVPGEEGGTGEEGDPTEKGIPDRGLPGEQGRPPRGENTATFKAGGGVPAGAKVKRQRPSSRKQKAEGKSLPDIIERLGEIAEEQKATMDPGRPEEDLLASQRIAEVDSSTLGFEGALKDASNVLSRSLLQDVSEGKALDAPDIIIKLKTSKAWRDFIKAATEAYDTALTKVVSAAAIHHSDIGIQPKDEVDYAPIITGLIKHKKAGVNAITNTFKKEIVTTVKNAKASGQTSSAEIETAVKQAIQNWQEAKAHEIALTTLTYGYNESTLNVADSAGATHVLVSDGEDTDAPCVEANGETWPISKAKENILEHPRCRRAFVPILS